MDAMLLARPRAARDDLPMAEQKGAGAESPEPTGDFGFDCCERDASACVGALFSEKTPLRHVGKFLGKFLIVVGRVEEVLGHVRAAEHVRKRTQEA